MADFLTQSQAYQGTFQPGTIEVDPIFQICAVANINASNQLEVTVWANKNGQRIDSDLGVMNFRMRDKAGALVSGVSGSGVMPDINGYFHITPVSAAGIYDLTHYIFEVEIDVDGVEVSGSIGLVRGE